MKKVVSIFATLSLLLVSFVPVEAGVFNSASQIVATGGTITYAYTSLGMYKIHTFNSSGTFTVTSGRGNVWYLVVAGGGAGAGVSGGQGSAGGGGAGGMRTNSVYDYAVKGGAYTVTVGNGGTGSTGEGAIGNNSVFDTITSTAGGGGALNPTAADNGGSGGGGASGATAGGTGTAGQGNDGGTGSSSAANYGGGGGGGASATGANGTSSAGGNGGAGTANTISGSSVTYAGGGGGGTYIAGTVGTGGAGGGGNAGASGGGNGSSGTANTGGGGGAASSDAIVTSQTGGSGGSGIVIVRYLASSTRIASSPTSSLTKGLIGYWTLDGTHTNWNTNKTNDVSGGGNTGTMTNTSTTTTPVAGKVGQAMTFDGSTSYVASTLSAGLSGSFTFAAWVYPTTDSGGEGIMDSDVASYSNYWATLYRGTSQSFLGSFSLYNGTQNPNVNTVSGTPLNTWTHLVGVRDTSTGEISIYKNGVFEAKATDNISGIPSYSAFNIGAQVSQANRYFPGRVDDVRVYSRALSAPEIFQLYKNTKGIVTKSPTSFLTKGLVGYWTFDGTHTNWSSASAGTTNDSSGQGNTGTLTNMSQSASPTGGKVGQGMKFDGSNDAVSVAAFDLSGTDKVSVAMWLRWDTFANDDALAFEMSTNFNSSQVGFMMDPNTGGGGCGTGVFSISLIGNVGTNQACYTRPSARIWHHYVAIYDKSQTTNEVDLYVDGAYQTPSSRSNTSNNTNTFGNVAFYIMSRATTSLFAKGDADDMRFYNRVLSPSEITALYNSTR